MENNCFDFIKLCNERLSNMNEYNIARVIINHISNIQNLSLEKISEEANISTASVSRFISRAGFSSFQEFKNSLQIFNKDVKMRRILSHTQRFMRTTPESMIELLYHDAINNLRQTKLNVDIDKLKEICKKLKNSHSVTIIGDSHELADFYTLQLDLLINNIPTYFININDENSMFVNHLNNQDIILYIDLHHEWFSGSRKAVMDSIKHKGLYTIILAQDENHIEDYADMLYIYGIQDSNNDGYYSLLYLSNILSEMIYYNF